MVVLVQGMDAAAGMAAQAVALPGKGVELPAVRAEVEDVLQAPGLSLLGIAAQRGSGFILEEGLPISDLKKIVHSMAKTAEEAGILIVAGDTKVVDGNGGLYINTTGVGFVPAGMEISPARIEKGDVVLVSGNLGDHHAAILSSRMSIENESASDCAPLNDIVRSLINEGIPVHAMRDITRGGIATVCKEMAVQSGKAMLLSEELLPMNPQVKDVCAWTGLDPL